MSALLDHKINGIGIITARIHLTTTNKQIN